MMPDRSVQAKCTPDKLSHLHRVCSVAAAYCNLLQSLAISAAAHKVSGAKFPTFTRRPSLWNLLCPALKSAGSPPSIKFCSRISCRAIRTKLTLNRFQNSSQEFPDSGLLKIVSILKILLFPFKMCNLILDFSTLLNLYI